MNAAIALLALTAPASSGPAPAEVAAPATLAEATTPEVELVKSSSAGKSKRPWLSAGLNWFVPGAGYMYNGVKPA